MTTSTDLCYTPATELGQLIRTKQISPVEITRAVLDRIERLNPTLHAFFTVTADHARELAQAAEARARRGELKGPLDLTGQPAANVPCGFTKERLPVGLQIVARWHRETDVFRAAACFEALQPWEHERPPLD